MLVDFVSYPTNVGTTFVTNKILPGSSSKAAKTCVPWPTQLSYKDWPTDYISFVYMMFTWQCLAHSHWPLPKLQGRFWKNPYIALCWPHVVKFITWINWNVLISQAFFLFFLPMPMSDIDFLFNTLCVKCCFWPQNGIHNIRYIFMDELHTPYNFIHDFNNNYNN